MRASNRGAIAVSRGGAYGNSMFCFRLPAHHWMPALVIFCTLLVSCGTKGKRADLVILNGAEPETLDPHLMTGQLEQRLAYALYEGLVFNDENGEIRPGVAEEWEISPDGKTYTFHLREGAMWSNGDPVTAQDFVDSWQRSL